MIEINDVGALGVNTDLAPDAVPPNGWTAGKNIRFFNRKVFASYGHASLLGVPIFDGYYLFPTLDNANNVLWAYMAPTAVGATDGVTHQDITRVAGAYTGTNAALWQGYNFGGISIFNNGVDNPQMWNTPALGTKLADLTNWPASTLARVVKGYKRYLVAYDVTKGATRYQHMVKWSALADIGSIPPTWDPTDTTREAGEWELKETEGAIIEAEPLGERNIIYKDDSVWSMREIGGRYIFAFDPLFSDFNILAPRCVGAWGQYHVVATKEDVVIHDGVNIESLIDNKMRRWYLGRFDISNVFRSFIAMNYAENEAWVCIPEQGQTLPSVAMIINLKDKTCVMRDLPSVAHIHYGKQPTSSSGTTFDTVTTSFDATVGYFGQSETAANRKRLVGISPFINRNLFLQSEDLSTSWTLTAATVTTNVDGTADKLKATAVAGPHNALQTIAKIDSTSRNFTVAAKIKIADYNYARLQLDDGTGTNIATLDINLVAGTIAASAVAGTFSILGSSIGATDSGGYRQCTLTARTGAEANIRGGIVILDNTPSSGFTGDGVKGTTYKELQLREGTAIGAYQTTTTVRATTGVFLYDSGFTFDGLSMETWIERTGSTVVGVDKGGNLYSEYFAKKFISGLFPHLQVTNGTQVETYVGMQDNRGGSVNWSGPIMYNPSTDIMADHAIEGRLWGVKIRATDGTFWELDGYNVDLTDIGQF